MTDEGTKRGSKRRQWKKKKRRQTKKVANEYGKRIWQKNRR